MPWAQPPSEVYLSKYHKILYFHCLKEEVLLFYRIF